jgi:hypothetical protein
MKKKYKTRFPMARIKKIMQTDEEVGKIALATPILMSKAVELFVIDLVKKVGEVTEKRNSNLVTPFHLKLCIQQVKEFDFLSDLVANISELDSQNISRRGRKKGDEDNEEEEEEEEEEDEDASESDSMEGEKNIKKKKKPNKKPVTKRKTPKTDEEKPAKKPRGRPHSKPAPTPSPALPVAAAPEVSTSLRSSTGVQTNEDDAMVTSVVLPAAGGAAAAPPAPVALVPALEPSSILRPPVLPAILPAEQDDYDS